MTWNEKRPTPPLAPAHPQQVPPATTTNEPNSTDITVPPVTADDWTDAADRINGVYVAVIRRANDHTTWRRCYFTLDAAVAAARRATDRGDDVEVLIAELRPARRRHAARRR